MVAADGVEEILAAYRAELHLEIIGKLLGRLGDSAAGLAHAVRAEGESYSQRRAGIGAAGLAAAQAAKLLGFEKADSSFLDGIVREVISANPDKVAEIQGGNEKLLNWLTGQVMKVAKGKANPKIVTEALKKALSME